MARVTPPVVSAAPGGSVAEMREPSNDEEGVTSASPAPGPSDTKEPNDALRGALEDLAAAESRVERNAQRIYDETRTKLVSDLLPVVDNLDRTISAGQASNDGPLLEGVRMVRAQLEQVLLRYGVERIDSAGETFDPALHHAISARVTGPELVGSVVEQLEAGYRFGGKVLRPAKVVVGVAG